MGGRLNQDWLGFVSLALEGWVGFGVGFCAVVVGSLLALEGWEFGLTAGLATGLGITGEAEPPGGVMLGKARVLVLETCGVIGA